MAFINELHNLQQRINIRNTIIILMMIFNLMLFVLLMSYPNRLRIDIPPDPRVTQTVKPGYTYPSTVHAFTSMIFQYLNTWEDGQKDYKDRRNSLRAYMTKDFYKAAQQDYKSKMESGELQKRSRTVSLSQGYMYKPEFVQVGDNTWVVTLVLDLEESVYNQVVKSAQIEYKILVVRHNVNPTNNPYQLALDGFAAPPKVLEAK